MQHGATLWGACEVQGANGVRAHAGSRSCPRTWAQTRVKWLGEALVLTITKPSGLEVAIVVPVTSKLVTPPTDQATAVAAQNGALRQRAN